MGKPFNCIRGYGLDISECWINSENWAAFLKEYSPETYRKAMGLMPGYLDTKQKENFMAYSMKKFCIYDEAQNPAGLITFVMNENEGTGAFVSEGDWLYIPERLPWEETGKEMTREKADDLFLKYLTAMGVPEEKIKPKKFEICYDGEGFIVWKDK